MEEIKQAQLNIKRYIKFQMAFKSGPSTRLEEKLKVTIGGTVH